MSTNIIEIAKRAGVSIATVSRALNNNGPVREETRQKILQISRDLNYKPNPIARGLSRKRTDTIGVILPELVDEFFMDIIRGIDEEAYRANKYVLVSSSHSQRDVIETFLEFMVSGRVDGVILMIPHLHEEAAELIRKSKHPLVMLNVGRENKDVVSFNIDNYQGAYAITRHLIEHQNERIAMIKGYPGNCDAEGRLMGYRDALDHSGIALDEDLVVQGDFTVRSGYDGFRQLMSRNKKPDAIFAANDMMALGIYEAARISGIRIPDDISVAGFDDIFLSRLLLPRLTTVHAPIQELGIRAIQYLFKIIDGEVDPKTPHREELSTSLIIGGSCGCPHQSGHNLF
ncbi:MAG: LacI family DNA-binding transcriptional regulator [Calditrichia bacterium]